MKKLIIFLLIGAGFFYLCNNCLGYSSFTGTYVGDLTLMQSGTQTTFTIKSNGFVVWEHCGRYEEQKWWPAESGGGIAITTGGGDNNHRYFMDKNKKVLYYGINDYMHKRNGYKIKKIK